MDKKTNETYYEIKQEKGEKNVSILTCILLLCFFSFMIMLQNSKPIFIDREQSMSVKVVGINEEQILLQKLSGDYIQKDVGYLLMLSEGDNETYETTNKYTNCDTAIYVDEIAPEAYQIGDVLKLSYNHISLTSPKVMGVSKVERIRDTELTAYERLITQLSVYSEVKPIAVSNTDIEEAISQKITINGEEILIYSFKSERAAKTAYKIQVENHGKDSIYLMDNLVIIYKGNTACLTELMKQVIRN